MMHHGDHLNNYYKRFKDLFQKSRDILNKYKLTLISLIILITFISLITYYRIKIQMNIGPIWDTYDFLSNALLFAGQGTGYSDLTRPPFISFLTSIFFRLGYLSSTSIFIVDGMLFIFGVVGFFLLLKLRFNNVESLLGSILYATFPIVISFAGAGLSDIPSVSFSIWAIYFTILAVKKNSKFFYFSFPLIMLAFLTRYPSALLIFPVIFYILINQKSVQKIRDIVIGIGISLLLLIPVLIFFYDIFGSPFYSFLNFFGSSSSAVSAGTYAYNPDTLYFLNHLPSFIGASGITIMVIVLSLTAYELFKFKKSISKIRLFNMKYVKKVTALKLILFTILTLIFIGTFGKLPYMASEVIFFILFYIFYTLLKDIHIKCIDMHLLFFAWFMAFFIFHSVYVVKDGRYFVTMAPAAAYFLLLGLSCTSNKIEFKTKNINLMSLFSVILIFIVLFCTVSYLPAIQEGNSNLTIRNENMALASNWLINYDPAYKDKIIYSELWPYSGWYLKTSVKMMPIIMNDQMYYTGIDSSNFSPHDSIASNNFLVSNDAYYCFSIQQGLNLTSYKPLKQFGNIIIYKRV